MSPVSNSTNLVNPNFQGVNRLFVLSFGNENIRISHSNYYLPKLEIKDYMVMIDGKNFFDQPIYGKLKTYENIIKIATGDGDDYRVAKENFKKKKKKKKKSN